MTKIRRKRRRSGTKVKHVTIEKPAITSISSLRDLIEYAYDQNDRSRKTETLWRLLPVMEELNDMVGMEDVKSSITDMIMYYTNDMHLHATIGGDEYVRSENDSLHTVITGNPGCGKTELAKIIAKIYSKLGVLDTEEVVYVKVTDFIGKYVGCTEHNTLRTLESARGKVLFCDEAYSLGDNAKSFSKAAINMINDWIEKNKHDMAFIVAGYEKELNERFFGLNPGLKRRFRWVYNIKKYSEKELLEIFKQAVRKDYWYLDKESVADGVFRDKDLFQYTGGDINIFLDMCKKAHTRRTFCMKNPEIKVLTKKDISEGMKLYKKYKKTMDEEESSPPSMYM